MLQKFSYFSPKSEKKLFELLNKYGAKSKLLAGGTDLLVNIRNGADEVSTVIDIKKIKSFSHLKFDKKSGLEIGANVTYIELIKNKDIKKHYPVLIENALKVGSPQLRNRGTIVGNICTASPAGDMSRALLCLDASVNILSDKESKIVKLNNFFKGVKKTILKPNEIVSKIIIPIDFAGCEYGDEKLKRIKGHDLAQAGVTIIKNGDALRVGISSCSTTPLLLKDFKPDISVSTVIKEAKKSISPIDDIRASKNYRIHMVCSYIERIMKKFK